MPVTGQGATSQKQAREYQEQAKAPHAHHHPRQMKVVTNRAQHLFCNLTRVSCFTSEKELK